MFDHLQDYGPRLKPPDEAERWARAEAKSNAMVEDLLAPYSMAPRRPRRWLAWAAPTAFVLLALKALSATGLF